MVRDFRNRFDNIYSGCTFNYPAGSRDKAVYVIYQKLIEKKM